MRRLVEIDVRIAKGFVGETISADTNRTHWANHGEKDDEIIIGGLGVEVADVERRPVVSRW